MLRQIYINKYSYKNCYGLSSDVKIKGKKKYVFVQNCYGLS